MKKNNHTANKQVKPILRATDIPAVILAVAVIIKLAANFIPTSAGDIFRPIGLFLGGAAMLAQAILWICTTIKSKKQQAS